MLAESCVFGKQSQPPITCDLLLLCGVLHCALLLHVAMQFGLYHLPEEGAWRKVSEDSGESRPFLLIDCTEKIFTTAQQPER